MLLRFFLGVVGGFFDLGQFRQVPAGLFLDQFRQGDVGRAHVGGVRDERAADGPAAGVELANAPGNKVDQNVGVANFLQCFFAEFSVQCFWSVVKLARHDTFFAAGCNC